MSRRLVSYSDISEDVPALVSPEQGEAGPSMYALNGGKRKRGGRGGEDRRKQGGMVHWDDPAYAEVEVEGDEEGEDGYGEAGGVVVEEGVDGEDEVYTDWKYDEFGEPFDGTHDLYPDLTDDYDSDQDTTPLHFAIPDVDEFHRSHPHPASPTTASSSSTTHRPPRAVGGGGRTLLHTELYSPLTFTHAYTAALHQYCTMHHLPSSPTKAQSALWTDAPAFDSLLAAQVREDTKQILHLQKAQHAKHGSNGGEQAKPAHTPVPHANEDGNTAWRKAVKTVQSTRNTIGAVLHPPSHPPPNTLESQQDQLDAYWYAGYQAGYDAATAATAATADDPPDASTALQLASVD